MVLSVSLNFYDMLESFLSLPLLLHIINSGNPDTLESRSSLFPGVAW